jgi:hypothetical protein
MDRLRRLVTSQRTFETAEDEHDATANERAPFIEGDQRSSHEDDESENNTYKAAGPIFSWIDFAVFLLLGVAMLWAW